MRPRGTHTLAAMTVVFALGAALHADAQVIRISGTVKDGQGRPVRGAIVTAENPDQAPPRLSTTSNDKGQFGMLGIRRGVWTFTVEAPGYESVRFRRTVTSGQQDSIDLRLEKSPVPVALPMDGTKASEVQQRIDRTESLAASRDLNGAITAWRDILVKVPALTSAYLRIGALCERNSDPAGALAVYRELLAKEPDNEKARAAVERLLAVK